MEQAFYLNRIFASLLPEKATRMPANFELVTLQNNQSLFRVGESVDYNFFPLTTVVSLLCLLENGKNVEIGTIGREGFIGVPTVIGSSSAIYGADVLIPGQAIRVRAEVLKSYSELNKTFYRLLMRHSLSLLTQFSQLAACNLCHHIPERVCRWLLMLQDRAAQDEFQITHEQIAERLGVRRSGISVQLGQIEETGAIQASRGKIKILDRRKLEDISCECYWCLAEKSRSMSVQSYTVRPSADSASQWHSSQTADQHRYHAQPERKSKATGR